MIALVTATEGECRAWLEKIDKANGWSAPETWSAVRQTLDGRWCIRHPVARCISPFDIPDPVELTDSDFPEGTP